MEFFKYVALVLITSTVQFSCYQTSENDRINLGLKVSTPEYSNDEEFESYEALCDELKVDEDDDHITNLFDELGIDCGHDHLTNLKLILEEDHEREVSDISHLKDQKDDNDHINWETDSKFIKQYFSLAHIVRKLGEVFPKNPKSLQLKARMDQTYKKILNLIEKEKRYNYNLQVFYSTLLQTITEDVSVLNKFIINRAFKRVDKLLKNPTIRYYLESITGIADLKELYMFNFYKVFNKMEFRLRDNEFSRKLRVEYKKSIKSFIEIVLQDIRENGFPLASINFILDKIEVDIIPLIENANHQSRSKVKRDADFSHFKELSDKDFRNGQFKDLTDEQIRQAQEELKKIIEELADIGVREIFRFLEGGW